jgi:cellulose synthase/poly-beta-1,6-N-acetylglucosamine synthase-like glycosyltransferase
MTDLANFLLDKNLLTPLELAAVLSLQNKSGCDLPAILFAEGYINPYYLYQAMAEFHQLPFADLAKYPCDKKLLNAAVRDDYKNLSAIPWKKDGDKIIIAVCAITPEIKNWAEQNYLEYGFALTSPFDINSSLNNMFAVENDADARYLLKNMYPAYSASNLFTGHQSKIFLAFLTLLIPLIIIFPGYALATIFITISFFYTATLLFKTILFFIGMLRRKRVSMSQKISPLPDSELPIYTILVPLYQEERTLKKLTSAIKALDYPHSKLDVKLIVEADDAITINAIKKLKCERMFEMIQVPYSLPRTKPKACNYALRFAKGDYVTIYDAEDIPDPLQLKKALATFATSPDDVVCVQARLNYFNRDENLLSRMFAIEYSTLFDFMLFGLEAMDVPIPLGGTSNHFKIKALNALYAWDPYNVTEDADLGIRIAQKGWRCKIIDSLTLEECPISLSAWIKQRSRWIKGHLQTYFVHMRHPFDLYKKVGAVGFFGVQFFLGAPALIFLISPLMWLLCALFVLGIVPAPHHMPHWFNSLISFSYILLFIGLALQVFYAAIAIMSNRWNKMLPYSLLFPFYWVLHSIASFKALWQLITRPHYWEKTNHGITKIVT